MPKILLQDMDIQFPKFTLDEGLSIHELQTTGSTLKINEIYDESDDVGPEPYQTEAKVLDFIGEPVNNFTKLAQKMVQLDENGFVKKQIIEEGGGLELHEGCTVFIAFSCYWEDSLEPFDAMSLKKPMEVDLNENGLLPGLIMAVKSMLVGELSVFLLSHQVMYGEMGIPPRIKPKATCAVYIKLIKSILTPVERKINFSESNMFQRVHKEVKMLYMSGYTLFKSNNFGLAANLFRKAVYMLHKCRLADENEEKIQENLLKKLYLNLAICYIKMNQPLKACTACNELNRLNALWGNGKALFQNAKALRMIGQYDHAEKRLLKAIKYCPDAKEMKEEWELLNRTRDSCDQSKLISEHILSSKLGVASDSFKKEMEELIKNFKANVDLCKLELPAKLNSEEMAYVKEVCIRENLFFNKIPLHNVNKDFEDKEKQPGHGSGHYFLDKEQENLSDVFEKACLYNEDYCQSVELEENENILV